MRLVCINVCSVFIRNWKSDGDDKSVQSLGISGSCCEDEDMDTFASDTEKDQAINKTTSMSSDTLYAVPHKTKAVNFQVRASISYLNLKSKL